jgi:hypothetical protein
VLGFRGIPVAFWWMKQNSETDWKVNLLNWKGDILDTSKVKDQGGGNRSKFCPVHQNTAYLKGQRRWFADRQMAVLQQNSHPISLKWIQAQRRNRFMRINKNSRMRGFIMLFCPPLENSYS